MDLKLKESQADFLREELGVTRLPDDRDGTERMLDALSDLLMDRGFKEDWEPNEFGLKVEELIDVFSAQLRRIRDHEDRADS